MKFEKSEKTSKLGKWKYQVTMGYQKKINNNGDNDLNNTFDDVLVWIKSNAKGMWTVDNSNVYFNELDDVYKFRIMFDFNIRKITRYT